MIYKTVVEGCPCIPPAVSQKVLAGKLLSAHREQVLPLLPSCASEEKNSPCFIPGKSLPDLLTLLTATGRFQSVHPMHTEHPTNGMGWDLGGSLSPPFLIAYKESQPLHSLVSTITGNTWRSLCPEGRPDVQNWSLGRVLLLKMGH